jgi:hypothetical protein
LNKSLSFISKEILESENSVMTSLFSLISESVSEFESEFEYELESEYESEWIHIMQQKLLGFAIQHFACLSPQKLRTYIYRNTPPKRV